MNINFIRNIFGSIILLDTNLSWGEQRLRELCAWLCKAIYPLIAFVYDAFMEIATFKITIEKEKIIYNFVLLIAIIMTFYIIFELIKYIIQPETMTDKEKGAGNLVKKSIIVVLLITFVPKIFTVAYKAEAIIIKNDIISKIVLRKTNANSDEFGRSFSWSVLRMFYYHEPYNDDSRNEDEECGKVPCEGIIYLNKKEMQNNGKLPYLTQGINETREVEKEGYGGGTYDIAKIHFDGIYAVVVGIIIAWMLVLYCVDLGARVFQLAFLEIISPIPIIAYLAPSKENMFSKWVKQCITTYLDVFIRIGIIYFILIVCESLLSEVNNAFSDASFVVKTALILGLLIFARRAPKMLGELFPSMGAASGTFGLSAKERGLDKVGKFGGRIIGAATGAAVGAAVGLGFGIGHGIRRYKAAQKAGKGRGGQIASGTGGAALGAVTGVFSGAARGIFNGGQKGNVLKNTFAGAKNQVKASSRFGNRQENGYKLGHQIGDVARNVVGARSRIDDKEKEKKPYDKAAQARKDDKEYESKQHDHSFKEAIEKKKGNKKVRAAVASYNKSEQRVKDLEASDSELRQSYAKGKVKHDRTRKQPIMPLSKNANKHCQWLMLMQGRNLTVIDQNI